MHLMTFSVVLQEDTFLHICETRMLPKMVCCSKLNEVNQFFCIFDSRMLNTIFLFSRKCLCCWPTGRLRHCTCSKL